MTIKTEGNSLNPDAYLELFDFDATIIGGSIYYYTNSPTGGLSAPILWRGNSYYPLPIEIQGYENKADGSAPARPQLALSNVNKFMMAAVLTLGDLVGMKVRRWRTFYKFTDSGSTPSTSAYFPIDEHFVTKKLPSSIKTNLSFELSGPLDRPGLKLPRRQILRDLGFPGVSRVRIR